MPISNSRSSTGSAGISSAVSKSLFCNSSAASGFVSIKQFIKYSTIASWSGVKSSPYLGFNLLISSKDFGKITKSNLDSNSDFTSSSEGSSITSSDSPEPSSMSFSGSSILFIIGSEMISTLLEKEEKRRQKLEK